MTQTKAHVAAREKDIVVLQNKLEYLSNRLYDQVDMLTARLLPILSPGDQSTAAQELKAAPPPQAYCPLVHEMITQQLVKLYDTERLLDEMLDRLQI